VEYPQNVNLPLGIVPKIRRVNNRPRHLDPAYQTALVICAMLNLAMLFIEGSVGLWIGSAALLADAGDFLEDAAVLGLAFVAIGWSVRARALAGLVQGLAMAGVGIGAIVQIVLRILEGGAPSPALMGVVAALALIVNGYCAHRLIRFRGVDACDLAFDSKRCDAERSDRCSRCFYRDC
jgi:Co/Zn/Cd efflux system component